LRVRNTASSRHGNANRTGGIGKKTTVRRQSAELKPARASRRATRRTLRRQQSREELYAAQNLCKKAYRLSMRAMSASLHGRIKAATVCPARAQKHNYIKRSGRDPWPRH
jgi:hypothetical protein